MVAPYSIERNPVSDLIRPDESEALRALLAQRILVLDGAMGTMIQGHQLTEQDYRGERFADWPRTCRATRTCCR